MCTEKPYVFEQATFEETIAYGMLDELMKSLDGKAKIIDKRGIEVRSYEELLKLINQK